MLKNCLLVVLLLSVFLFTNCESIVRFELNSTHSLFYDLHHLVSPIGYYSTIVKTKTLLDRDPFRKDDSSAEYRIGDARNCLNSTKPHSFGASFPIPSGNPTIIGPTDGCRYHGYALKGYNTSYNEILAEVNPSKSTFAKRFRMVSKGREGYMSKDGQRYYTTAQIDFICSKNTQFMLVDIEKEKGEVVYSFEFMTPIGCGHVGRTPRSDCFLGVIFILMLYSLVMACFMAVFIMIAPLCLFCLLFSVVSLTCGLLCLTMRKRKDPALHTMKANDTTNIQMMTMPQGMMVQPQKQPGFSQQQMVPQPFYPGMVPYPGNQNQIQYLFPQQQQFVVPNQQFSLQNPGIQYAAVYAPQPTENVVPAKEDTKPQQTTNNYL